MGSYPFAPTNQSSAATPSRRATEMVLRFVTRSGMPNRSPAMQKTSLVLCDSLLDWYRNQPFPFASFLVVSR